VSYANPVLPYPVLLHCLVFHSYSSCYADREEFFDLLRELKKHEIVDFTEISDPPTDRGRPSMVMSLKLTLKARMAFEKNINSAAQFEEVLMSMDRGGNTVNINNSPFVGNATAGSQNTSNLISDGFNINDGFVEESLKRNGITEQQIATIKPLIAEMVVEYNKENLDKDRLHAIFSKIKDIGGTFFLLAAFNFLSKPECVHVVENLKGIISSYIYMG
jgi:hypothetical protein